MDNRITGLPAAAVTVPSGGFPSAFPPEYGGRHGNSSVAPSADPPRSSGFADHGWGSRGVPAAG